VTNEAKPDVLADIEIYHDFAYFAFERVSDGKKIGIEVSRRTDRAEDDAKRDKVRGILLRNRIITFNGQSYDAPLLWYFVFGATNAQLKKASDRIINGNVRYWEVEDLLQIQIPRSFTHIDMIEPQPNAFASLKTLNGRLHGKRMQDLPVEPDARLTDAEMDGLIDYCANSDIPASRRLLDALVEPLAMREALSKEYGVNFMSKSDSQIGEGIIKKRVEQATGSKVSRIDTPAGTSFQYKIPPYLRFQTPQLQNILDRLRDTEFYVKSDGKVEMPKWLSDANLTIGNTTYAMGIGGLHSTESNRAVHSDEDHQLRDFDVASYYPAIILGSGLYPKSLGPSFLDVYRKIREDRIVAKRAGNKVVDMGLKIALNGVFGKLGSRYSILYAPHLLITVTLTGQLALLMLIERAEQAGIPVVSGNTDGVVFRYQRDREGELLAITKQWETETGFELEATDYESLYNLSVNTYIAVKPDGKTKRKGTLSNPWKDNDIRGMLMKNPNAVICSDAVVELIVNGTPIEETIRGCTDIRDFVTVVNVKGGGTWRGGYLGKVVRYYWAHAGEEIFYKTPHERTGNFKKVPRTDGCRPLMDLPDEVPADIDYDRYIAEANEILMDIGYTERPPVVKPIRLFKYNAVAYFALAV